MKSGKLWPRTLHALSAAALLAATGAAHATLVNLGDGTVKDTNTNLIWLQDWGSAGSGNLASQIAWADNLDFAGSTEWRLPSLDEFQSLRSVYGSFLSISLFSHVSRGDYWTTTPSPALSNYWRVVSGDGSVSSQIAIAPLLAVAVRAGSAVTTVPEPQTLALALLALGAMAVPRRRPRSSATPEPSRPFAAPALA